MLSVMEIRFAFERDMLRRGTWYQRMASAEKHGSCVICGEVFKKKTPSQLTCSHECGRLHKNETQRVWHRAKALRLNGTTWLPRPCIKCTQEYKPTMNRQKYCPECSPHLRRLRREKEQIC